MKRFLWLLALLPGLAFGQAAGPYGIFGGPIPSTSLPAPSTKAGAANTYAFTSDQGLLESNGSTWGQISGGGGASTFDAIGSGDNISATMTCDSGCSILYANTGTIAASTAAALSGSPTQCTAGQFATGISTSGNANCSTPTGSGTVSSGTSGQVTVYGATGTTVSGLTVGANTLLGGIGAGVAALTPPQVIGILNSGTANAQTGTSYTSVLSDANTEITMNNASANTLTLPTNATVAYPVGTVLTVQQLGSGVTTVSPAVGVTLQSAQFGSSSTQGYPLGGVYGFIQLQQVQTNTWNVSAYNPGPGTFALSGTCTSSASSGNASRGTITASSAGGCTFIITPSGVLPAAHGWEGSMGDRTQPTVPSWHESSSSTTAITFTVPAAIASSDVLSFEIGPY